MGLFGISEYTKLRESAAANQAEAARQLDRGKEQQAITDQQQRGHEEVLEASRIQLERSAGHLERCEKLLDIWEEQTRRFDLLLKKWEQQ